MDVSQSEIAAGVAIGQSLVVEAKQLQNRGVQVVEMHFVHDRIIAVVVGRAVARDPASRRRRPSTS